MRPRVLLLHGFAGGPWGFAGFRRALGPRWECLCPNLPGHATAPGELTPRSFTEGIADFAATLQPALGEAPDGIHLLGYSLGARTALGLLARSPERFASVTLVGVHPGLRSESERRARAESDQRWVRLLRLEGIAAFSDAWEAQPLFLTQRTAAGAALNAQHSERRRLSATGLAWSLETFGLAVMPDYWPLLRAPSVPVHLIAGELDGKFRGLAELARSHNPTLDLTIIPSSGHNPVLEQPSALAEAFTKGAEHD